MMEQNSKSQWIIFSLLATLTLLSGLVYSLQAPFYPIEAQAKGVTITEIGFIYAVYELTSFIFAPFAGTLMTKIGPVVGLYWGIFLTGIGILAVGFLDFVKDPTLFITLSILLRVIQAVGATSRAIAIVSMITFSFPTKIGTTFASIESFFGIGVCSGVVIAGYLMELTGFMWTFIIAGGLLLLTLPFTICVLRKCDVSKKFDSPTKSQSSRNHEGSNNNTHPPITVFTLMRIPIIALSVFTVVGTSISLGFTMGVLEPHLEQFKLSPILIGLMFLFRDLAYALASPFLGCLFDKLKSPLCIRLIGPVLISLAFVLIGPANFVPLKPHVWLTAMGLILLGIGMSSAFVSSFLFAIQDAKKFGTGGHDDITINELISGIWRSGIALGLFAGPSIAGGLYNLIGFPNESLIIIGLQLLQIILIIGCVCFRTEKNYTTILSAALEEDETTPLIQPSDYLEDPKP